MRPLDGAGRDGVRALAGGESAVMLLEERIAVGIVTGRLGDRGWPERTFVISGSAISAAAFLLLATTGTRTALWQLCVALLLIGLGFGQFPGQLILLVQQKAPSHQLGVATTAIRFFQTLGSALGATGFGTLLSRLYDGPGDVGSLAALHGPARAQGMTAYVSALDTVFLCGAGVMALSLLLALRLPKTRPVPRAETAREAVAA
ncbi:MFS transporter [Streptomyces sp. NPDC007971]|uniref:MFS transporter n=1 Tax=Streptomyces sp. NPDC007971 TaxID=3364799 RepID=UPI0036E24E99